MAKRLKSRIIEYISYKVNVADTFHFLSENLAHCKISTKTIFCGLLQAIKRETGKFMLFYNSVFIFQEDQYIRGQTGAHAVHPKTCKFNETFGVKV